MNVRSHQLKKKIGHRVDLAFQVTQHRRDEQLMRSLICYFGCGFINDSSGYSWLNFMVTKVSDLYENILPFFKKYPIRGIKAKDFNDWSLILEIVNNKGHLTKEGVEKIKLIKNGMNSRR